jgi:hypothetical protein
MKNSKYTIPKLHKSQYCGIKWARACGTFEVRRGDRCGASAEVEGVSDDAIHPGVFVSRSIISHTKISIPDRPPGWSRRHRTKRRTSKLWLERDRDSTGPAVYH